MRKMKKMKKKKGKVIKEEGERTPFVYKTVQKITTHKEEEKRNKER